MKRVNLKKARQSLSLTQVEFAKKVGIHVDSVRSLEYGRVKPSSPVMLKICSLVNEKPEVLFPDMVM
jgi:DNA-binding XRE family transcriptional regulator